MKHRLIIASLSVAVLLLLTAHFILGGDYLEQRQWREELAGRINEVSLALAGTPEPAPGLRGRLAEAETGLKVSRNDFPGDVNSTYVINEILELAEECEVDTVPLVTQSWQADAAAGGYSVFRLDLTVSGRFGRLQSFISRLESGRFAALIIDDFDIIRTGLDEDEESVLVRAGLSLEVYSRAAGAGREELP